MNKVVIIINGSGGVGKDTLCTIAAKHYDCINISTVDEVKEIAKKYGGWDGVTKDVASRKFLSDLKNLLTLYLDRPFVHIMEKVGDFSKDTKSKILFIHSREKEEINRLQYNIVNFFKIPCLTLLVTQSNYTQIWGNTSDDNISLNGYNEVFDNYRLGCFEKRLTQEVIQNSVEEKFLPVLKNIVDRAEGYYRETDESYSIKRD